MGRRQTKRQARGRKRTIRGGSTDWSAVTLEIERDTIKNMMFMINETDDKAEKIQHMTEMFEYIATTREILRNPTFRNTLLMKISDFRRQGRRHDAPKSFYDALDAMQSHVDRI